MSVRRARGWIGMVLLGLCLVAGGPAARAQVGDIPNIVSSFTGTMPGRGVTVGVTLIVQDQTDDQWSGVLHLRNSQGQQGDLDATGTIDAQRVFTAHITLPGAPDFIDVTGNLVQNDNALQGTAHYVPNGAPFPPQSAPFRLVRGDGHPPVVKVAAAPVALKWFGGPVQLQAQASDASGITSLTMRVLLANGDLVQDIPLSPGRGSVMVGEWNAPENHTAVAQAFLVEVTAVDGTGLKTVVQGRLTQAALDTTDPRLAAARVSPASAKPGSPIKLSVQVTESESLLTGVKATVTHTPGPGQTPQPPVDVALARVGNSTTFAATVPAPANGDSLPTTFSVQFFATSNAGRTGQSGPAKLTVLGQKPVWTVTPATLNFAPLSSTHTTDVQSVTVTNTGTATAHLELTIDPSSARSRFTLDAADKKFDLAPGASRIVAVTETQAGVILTGKLTLTSHVAGDPPKIVQLVGAR
jgi:hypothetical protein